MEILLCQACGSILRGKSKYCTGCGAFVSRYSPTTISSSGRSASPLTINFAPDPLVMEKAISRRQLDQYRTSVEGNGSNGGNGNHSDPSGALAAYSSSANAPEQAAPQAESIEPTSLLGSVLKGVSNKRASFGSDASSLISFDEEPAAPAVPEPLPPMSPTPNSPVQPGYVATAQNQPVYQPASQPVSPPASFGGFPTEIARPPEITASSATPATIGDYPAQPPATTYGSEQANQSAFNLPQPAAALPAEPPTTASATGPLVPPAAITQGNGSNFASPTPAISGPVFSARVPIPFLPRPSNFLRSQPNSSELDAIATPTAGPAAAFAQIAEAAPPAASQQTATQPFDSLTDDPFFSQPANIQPAELPNDPLFNPATAPYPVTGHNDPLFTPAQSLPGSGVLPNDPLFAPTAQIPAASSPQTDPLFTPAPTAAASPANNPYTQPATPAPPDMFAPGGNSSNNGSMPGALPPDPRETGIFGKQSVNPTAFSFGEPTITSPSAEAILPPLYPVSGPEPPPPAPSTTAQTAQTAQAVQAVQPLPTQPDGFFAATGTPANQPPAATSGFDFFNAPATAAPLPAQQAQLQPQVQVQPAATLSPMDLFQGEVISHPPGSTGPQPNQITTASQPASMEFDPAPPRQAAPSASPASGNFYDSVPAPIAPANNPAGFEPAAGLNAPPASQSLPVSAEASAGGAPTSGADFFSGGGQASTSSAKVDGPKYSGLDRDEAADKDEDDEQKSTTKDKTGTGLREKAARESDAPAAKGSFFEQVMEFLKDLDGECSVLGKMLPKKQVLICGAVLTVIGIQVAFAVFGMVSKGVTGALGGMQQQAANNAASQFPPLTGTWELAYQALTEQKVHPGTVALSQKGSSLYGEGRDEAMFVMQGTFNPPKVLLSKQYIVDGQPKGKPITWSGMVTFPKQGQPFMEGQFVAYIKKGVFTSAHLEEVRGRWQAEMVAIRQPGDVRTNFNRDQTQPAPTPGPPSQDDQNQPDTSAAVGVNLPDLFMKIAVGLLFLGVLLVIGSLKLFGPSGLINIWSKKEYIPSQFKSQHKKMLKELGKPLRPGGLPLGEREDWNALKVGEPKELHLTPELRDSNPHMLIMGAGSKGKSRLIANMITHDIQSGDRAAVLIDSDGHLVDLILRWLASHPKGKEFSRRVLVIDPTNKAGCAAFNPLEPPEDGDYQSAASSVVYGFKAIYTEPPGSQTQWNQQTANILRNSALLLMANNKTLTDLPRLLGDNDFRDELLEKIERRKNERVEFITLLDQWAQYKRLARTDQWINWVEPILNRVTPMLGDPRIRPILTSSKGDLSLRQIIQDQQILLVKIPQGQLDQNASLLGSLLVTGIKQAALSLSTSSTKKHFTALYLDEFDNFIEKETFDAITSETRKFQIGFTASIKSVQHLPEDFRNQLVINVGTICAFSLAKKDADVLGPSMFRVDGRKVKHQTIQNIFNKVNTSPQFELISDEEKLNIDRLVGQEERTYFCYRVGTVAGVFHMKAHEFKDVPDKDVNWTLVDQIYGNKKSEV